MSTDQVVVRGPHKKCAKFIIVTSLPTQCANSVLVQNFHISMLTLQFQGVKVTAQLTFCCLPLVNKLVQGDKFALHGTEGEGRQRKLTETKLPDLSCTFVVSTSALWCLMYSSCNRDGSQNLLTHHRPCFCHQQNCTSVSPNQRG